MNKSLIFSDVHGCGKELERLIQPFLDLDLYSLGDNFDRAFDGVLVWEILQKHGVKCLAGNHEIKMLKYLKGELEWVPKHYYYFLNEFAKKYDTNDLIDWLEALPLMIQLDNHILVHAGVDPNNPSRIDLGYNVYGRSKTSVKSWLDEYDGDRPVIYGHTTHNEPLIRSNNAGIINSICIDTAACHGNKLTAILLEDHTAFSFHQVISPDYSTRMKKLDVPKFEIK